MGMGNFCFLKDLKKDLKKCYCLSEKCKVVEEMMLQFCHIL